MKTQEIALRIFFPCMFGCALAALIGIWFSEYLDETYFKVIPTFFIIGFASFITWIVSVVRELLALYKTRKN